MDGPLVAYHVSEDAVELLDLEVADDGDAAVIEATATIEHFSVIVVGSIRINVAALVEVEASASSTDVVVGDSFDVGVAVTRRTDKQTVEAEFGAVELTDLDGAETLAWLNLLGGGIAGFALEDVPGGKQIAVYEVSPLKGGWRIGEPALGARGPIEPDRAPLASGRVRPEDDFHLFEPVTFTCRAVGSWTLATNPSSRCSSRRSRSIRAPVTRGCFPGAIRWRRPRSLASPPVAASPRHPRARPPRPHQLRARRFPAAGTR